jgi:hypothetical protein
MVMQYTRNFGEKHCLCVISMWSAHFTSSVGQKIMYTVLFEDGSSSVVEEGISRSSKTFKIYISFVTNL